MTRELWVRPAPADIVAKIPSARQVIARRIVSEPRHPAAPPRKTEIHFYILVGKPGQRRLSAARLERLIRGHWGIENRLHHVLDRTLREDAQQTRVKDGPLVLSLLRKTALAVIEPLRRKTGRTRPEIQTILAARPRRAISLIKRSGG